MNSTLQADGIFRYIKYEELKFDGGTQRRMCMHQVLLQLLLIDRSTDIKKKSGKFKLLIIRLKMEDTLLFKNTCTQQRINDLPCRISNLEGF